MKIGILSDTHDLLRPEVAGCLRGCGLILHGGDISSRKILDELEAIAPVKAVRGNNDKEWAACGSAWPTRKKTCPRTRALTT